MSTVDTVAQLTYSLLNIITAASADLQRLQTVKDDPEALEAFRVELKARSDLITEGLRK